MSNEHPIVVFDFYSCAGGAAKGFLNAGADIVIGFDINPQPRYAGTHFVQIDCIAALTWLLAGGTFHGYGLSDATFLHASPPCQARSDLQKQSKLLYAELVPPTRELLKMTGLPYVIENVEGETADPEAALIDPVRLCGANDDAFPELRVIRHRLFESNVPLRGVPCPETHPLCFTMDKRKSMYGQLDQDDPTVYVHVNGGGNAKVRNKARAMGIDWMIGKELNEAIPPAYTEWIGKQMLEHISSQQPQQEEDRIRYGITQAEACA